MSDKPANDQIIICNCQQTMQLDGEALASALDQSQGLTVHKELCRSQIEKFNTALAQADAAGGSMTIACTQEAALFREVAQANGHDDVPMRFCNIRERAGWCENSANTGPKIAALLGDAAYDTKPVPALTITSQGSCVVYGAGQTALDAALKLSSHLDITLLLSRSDDIIAPANAVIPVFAGRISAATGSLGAFTLSVDGYAPLRPSSRSTLDFSAPRDGAQITCDLLFDMSGDTPAIANPKHRDGYVQVDPSQRAAVSEAMFELIDLVGEFEKPLYVRYQSDICAHARSGQIGCRNCLDSCPTGALTPNGDHIKIDTALCGGCGNCSASCPTGAISYAYPQRYDLIKRAQGLLTVYTQAGGAAPCLLLHDESHGAPLICAMARYGRGLPANMLPLSLYSVFQLGHDAFAAMIGAGAHHICVLVPPGSNEDLPALENQIALMQAILDGLGLTAPRLHLINERDPQAAEDQLHGLGGVVSLNASVFDPVGSKRDVARGALAKLHQNAPAPTDLIALPKGAPYGRIAIDGAACTLCLSCVGACPVSALADHADRPQVSFTESACVQCGLCRVTCPENAITLEPRYNFSSNALNEQVLHFEEPFDCVECGKPFGAKSSVNMIVEKLKDHPMFAKGDQIRLIQMCDECRIVVQANANDDPFSGGARPRIRTTDDDLAEQAKARAKAKAKFKAGIKDPDDFLS